MPTIPPPTTQMSYWPKSESTLALRVIVSAWRATSPPLQIICLPLSAAILTLGLKGEASHGREDLNTRFRLGFSVDINKSARVPRVVESFKRVARRKNQRGEREKERKEIMEEELKCPVCHKFYEEPVILPCSHSGCLNCIRSIQISGKPVDPLSPEIQQNFESDYPEADRSSIYSTYSEADSGVSFGYSLNSAASGAIIANGHSTNATTITASDLLSRLACPTCSRIIYLDQKGVDSFPRNRAVESIILRQEDQRNGDVKCQLCESDPFVASVYCEQCEIFYCGTCRDSFHPSRGPLKKHVLVSPLQGKASIRDRKKKPATCGQHVEESLSMYCHHCRTPVCYACLEEGRHNNHDVKPLAATYKTLKTDLSQTLTTVTDKARRVKDFLKDLKTTLEHIEVNTVDFEASLVAQCDALIEALQRRKEELLQHVAGEREFKTSLVRQHVNQYSAKLRKTTALLEYGIEVMKENDPASFLLVANSLVSRICSTDSTWNKELVLEGRVTPEFDLTLDTASVLHAIQNLNFVEMKAPSPPAVLTEECSAENNSVTITWRSMAGSHTQGYILELDDGNSGEFREVYCGPETVCTVDGLHFDSVYNARVKAYNHAGEGPYSPPVCLQTAEVAWFSLDPSTAHPDLVLTNQAMTATCTSSDQRVVLGNVGFSRGVHYWEVTLDRCQNNPDPAFGVARFDVAKEGMLGSDARSWAMYIDSRRSWFKHASAHHQRTEGGIGVGSVVGVLLDLDKGSLSFYVNDQPQGPLAFTGLQGVFFPAVSLNRNVQVTLHTGIDLPSEAEFEEE